MDLLGDAPALMISDESWRIYSRHEPHSPQYVSRDAIIENSLISEGCDICGRVENSVLGAGVVIEQGATVRNSLIFNGAVIGAGALVDFCIIDSNVSVGERCVIGDEISASSGLSVIGAGVRLESESRVCGGKMIYA